MSKNASKDSSGAQRRNTDAFLYPHDIIKFTLKCKDNIFIISKEFYDQGANLKEIARLTGFARTSIRTALLDGGVVLRTFDHANLKNAKKPKTSQHGVSPFGYSFQQGELVTDIKEYKTVLAILKLWQQGTPLNAIVAHLNTNNIPTRHGLKWNNGLVKIIIKKNQQRKIKKAI